MQYVQKLKKFNNKNKGKDQRNNSNKEKYKIKITWVQNNKRMFATYNIVNAAFNFCYNHDIQILIDGDD